ncbi:MAG: hypothetical protein ACE5ER_11730, partial [Nitrospinaceae bacterium]
MSLAINHRPAAFPEESAATFFVTGEPAATPEPIQRKQIEPKVSKKCFVKRMDFSPSGIKSNRFFQFKRRLFNLHPFFSSTKSVLAPAVSFFGAGAGFPTPDFAPCGPTN